MQTVGLHQQLVRRQCHLPLLPLLFLMAVVPDSAAGLPAIAPSAPPVGVAPAVVADVVAPKPAVYATTDVHPLGTVAGAPAPPTGATPALPLTRQVLPDPQRHPQSPACCPSRLHSPPPCNERETNRRRRDSPRCRQPQAGWPVHRGGRGGWMGGCGYGGGWGDDDAPASIADVRHIVSAAIRDGRTGSASQSSSLQEAPSPADPRRGAPPVVAVVVAELPRAAPIAPASAPAGNAVSAGLRLPRVPPLAGMEFVSAGGGAARAQYPPLVAVDPAPSAVDEPLPYLAEGLLPPYVRVLEATLGQLWRLSESLCAILLVQVLAHAPLPPLPVESLQDGPRDDCLDAADQLALLLAPVLTAPARGGVGAVSQHDAAVRGLRRYLRAGSGASAISASTLVVRKMWRTLQGILHAMQADRM
ncbi:unnamed protein product [Closterium sp. NIES-53]